MTIFERYILRQMLGPLGFFVLVLTGVVWLTQSLRIIDIVVNNGQGARVFLEFTAFLLPVVLSIVLQLGALAATIYTLHRLIIDSEMIAAFAGGASRLRLARPIIVFGVGLMAMLAIDTLYLMPTAARAMRDRLAEVRSDIAAGLIRDGRFLNPSPGLTVYIREITPAGELLGVMVQDARDRTTPVIYTAQRGFLAREDEAPTLVLFDGHAQRLEGDGGRLALLRFDSFAYDLSSFIGDNAERARKPSERYFWELIWPDPDLAPDRRSQGKMIAEGHEQLSAPLYGLALPLVAAAAMLSAAFSRRGVAGAVIMAIALGAGLRVIGLAAKSMVTGAPEFWLVMYAPPLIGVIGALLWLRFSGAPKRKGSAGDGGAPRRARDPKGRGKDRALAPAE